MRGPCPGPCSGGHELTPGSTRPRGPWRGPAQIPVLPMVGEHDDSCLPLEVSLDNPRQSWTKEVLRRVKEEGLKKVKLFTSLDKHEEQVEQEDHEKVVDVAQQEVEDRVDSCPLDSRTAQPPE